MRIRTGPVPGVTAHHNTPPDKYVRRARTRALGLIGALAVFAVLLAAGCGRGAGNDNGVATAGGAESGRPNRPPSRGQGGARPRVSPVTKDPGGGGPQAGPRAGDRGPVAA